MEFWPTQLDPDAGVALQDVGDQPGAGVEPCYPEHPEPDGAGLEGLGAPHRLLRRVDGGQHLLGVGPQGVGHGRRDDAAPDPTEQLHPERLLEPADLLGDARLRVPELLGRPGQRPVLVGGEEACDLVHTEQEDSPSASIGKRAYPYTY